jgi:ligand-binding SRPBCC domain-containing protein
MIDRLRPEAALHHPDTLVPRIGPDGFPPRTMSLLRTQFVPVPRPEVFAFFSEADNLGLITPPNLDFTITSPRPIAMQVGTLIGYRIRLHGIPMRWKTRILDWEPPHRFVDLQLHGPYRFWLHEHEFRETRGGTTVTDRVWYRLPALGPLARPVGALVRRQLNAIFDFRAEAVRRALAVEFAT